MTAPTEPTWSWQRQPDGSYRSETGWVTRKVHRSGRAQHVPFERTPAETKAGDHYELIRPDGTRALDTAGTLAAAKLQAERRAFFDVSVTQCPGCNGEGGWMETRFWGRGPNECYPDPVDCPACGGTGRLSAIDAAHVEAQIEDEIRYEEALYAEEEAASPDL